MPVFPPAPAQRLAASLLPTDTGKLARRVVPADAQPTRGSLTQREQAAAGSARGCGRY